MNKHTPIPWSDNFEKGNGQILHRASGMEIARCSLPNYGINYGEMKEIRRDNAAFIVEAVNNHERFKGAIGKAIEQIESNHITEAAQTLKRALGLREAGKEKS